MNENVGIVKIKAVQSWNLNAKAFENLRFSMRQNLQF